MSELLSIIFDRPCTMAYESIRKHFIIKAKEEKHTNEFAAVSVVPIKYKPKIENLDKEGVFLLGLMNEWLVETYSSELAERGMSVSILAAWITRGNENYDNLHVVIRS